MEDALRGMLSKDGNTLNNLVLILVLMEDALRDRDYLCGHKGQHSVLILVLMEDALRESQTRRIHRRNLVGLNPCSNGRCSARKALTSKSATSLSLNPCSNGRCSARANFKTC